MVWRSLWPGSREWHLRIDWSDCDDAGAFCKVVGKFAGSEKGRTGFVGVEGDNGGAFMCVVQWN